MSDSKNESALVSDEGETQLDAAKSSLFDYLNNNGKWEKSKVDSLAGEIKEYKELYDKMNSYDYDYLECIPVDTGQCQKLDDIINVAREAKQRNIEMNGKYFEDGSITVSRWLEKVKGKISEAKAETKKTSEAQPSEGKVADGKKDEPNEHAAPASRKDEKTIKTSSNGEESKKKVTIKDRGSQGTEKNGNKDF